VTVWIEIEGRVRKVELPSAVGDVPGEMACMVDGRAMRVDARMVAPGVMSLVLEGGRQVRCVLDVSPEGEAVIVDGRRMEFAVSDPRSLRAGRGAGAGTDGPRAVKAPMPGRVVRVLVAVGDEVATQQGLVVIEAMKMQNELKSPKAGRVVRLGAGVGETVQAGEVLAVVEQGWRREERL
jgi:biotin carboxyl carrier protein